eukprot:m.138339 g.138339  ORF g.138339 m.138339 type:complete len:850 (+) comp16628_c0_seq7:3832-6381(+)
MKVAPICCVMPPASPSCTLLLRILSSSLVLPVSTWPMTTTTGERSSPACERAATWFGALSVFTTTSAAAAAAAAAAATAQSQSGSASGSSSRSSSVGKRTGGVGPGGCSSSSSSRKKKSDLGCEGEFENLYDDYVAGPDFGRTTGGQGGWGGGGRVGVSSDEEDGDEEDEDEDYDVEPLRVDVEGIEARIMALPLPVGRYGQVLGLADGQLIYTRFPAAATEQSAAGGAGGDGNDAAAEGDDDALGSLCRFRFKSGKETVLREAVSYARLSSDRQTCLMCCHDNEDGSETFRVHKAGEKPLEDNADSDSDDDLVPGERSGILHIDSRLDLEIDPSAEWRQMLDHTYRSFRDLFWDQAMNHVDWPATYAQFRPLVERVASRAELADLQQEMTVELGCSHIFQSGGDFMFSSPHVRNQGMLGADTQWDDREQGYRITHIVHGDHWRPSAAGPLARLGLHSIRVGDVLVAINRTPLSPLRPPTKLLANAAGKEIYLSVKQPHRSGTATPSVVTTDATTASATARTSPPSAKSSSKHGKRKGKQALPAAPAKGIAGPNTDVVEATAPIRILRAEVVNLDVIMAARYRDWVKRNTEFVHRESNGQFGYVHVPDMDSSGFGDFHRYYLTESQRGGLVMDVRSNPGGNISELLVQKITQRMLGWDVPRHGVPTRFPQHVCNGPLVLLVDENTGSDGDVITHSFKMLKLGTVVGRRTWGGVCSVGGTTLVDQTEVSIPVSGFYTLDSGYGIENRGVEPDVTVDYRPQDYHSGTDPQLARAVKELFALQASRPPIQLPAAVQIRSVWRRPSSSSATAAASTPAATQSAPRQASTPAPSIEAGAAAAAAAGSGPSVAKQ